MENLEFTQKTMGNWTVLAISGRLDRLNAAEAGTAWGKILADSDRLVLELSEMEYLSSAGIRILLRLAQQSEDAGKGYAICCSVGFVKEVLEDADMDMLVKVCSSLDELGD